MTVAPRFVGQDGAAVGYYAKITKGGRLPQTNYGTWEGTGTLTYSATFTICGALVQTLFEYDGSPRTPNISADQQRCQITAIITVSDDFGTTSVAMGSLVVPDVFYLLSPGSLNFSNTPVTPGTVLRSGGATWATMYAGTASNSVSRCPSSEISVSCVIVASGLPNNSNGSYSVVAGDIGYYIVFTSEYTYGNITKQGFAGASGLVGSK
jgi:hypothetical protein